MDSTPSEPNEAPRRGSRFLVRLLLVAAPLLVTLALEAGLRLAGYGVSDDFFEEYEGTGAYAPNLDFVYRFYSRATAQDPPIPFLMPAEKPDDTYRIFVLGSSAAWGMPSSAFNFGRMLEAMLSERFPGVNFEVVNTSILGINSHIVRWTAEDCAEHDPDLFLVYLGNNEVIGLYGPGTDPRNASAGRTPLRRAGELYRATRIRQLADDLFGTEDAGDGDGVPPGLDEFREHWFTQDDPRRAPVWGDYRANLEAICDVAERAGARTVLSTLSVNLRDCAPFGSLHRAGLADEDLARFDAEVEAGAALEADGRADEALARYRAAEAIDGGYAELHYRMARCAIETGDVEEAARRYDLAWELDAYQCRADARLNGIVREVAAERGAAGQRVDLVDAEAALKASPYAADGLPGERLFYDHVHFTLGGNYEVAKALYPVVAAAVQADRGVAPVPGGAGGGGPLTIEEVAGALGWTTWHAIRLRAYMLTGMSQLPFAAQLDHASWVAAEQARVAGEIETFAGEDFQRAHAVIQRALQGRPDDWELHFQLVTLYRETGQDSLAQQSLRTVLRLMPCNEEARQALAATSGF